MAFIHLLAAFEYVALVYALLPLLMPSCLSASICHLSYVTSFVHHISDLEFGLDHGTASSIAR